VALGCNIHDRMQGFIKVVDTPFAALTNAAGQTRVDGIAAGNARLTVWHPRLKAKHNEATFVLDVPAAGAVAKQIQIGLR
jgi:hypothetical protein